MSKVKTDEQGRLILPDEFLMQVRVKLFASLCRYFSDVAPGIPFEMELPEGAAVADLVDRLKLPREEVNPVRKDRALTPPFFKMSIIYFFILAINGGVSNGVKVFFVNGRARPMDWPLKPDDDVGIFPLVAGG